MENLFENINKIELISYFSSEIFCILGILINIVMFLFFSRKYNIKRLSDITTFGVFAINSLITFGIYLNGKDTNFGIFNNLFVFNSETFLLKFLTYLFFALFVLTMYKTSRKARFKMTIVNSCLLILAPIATLLLQVENKILAFLLLDICSFFIYKYASNIRIKKPDIYCFDFILISAASTVLFYLFFGLTYFIKQELQLAIIEVCMICALFLKAGLFPIYNYGISKKAKNSVGYAALLYNFLPFLSVVAFLKFYQSINFSNEIYFVVIASFVMLVAFVSAICAFQVKNLIKFLAYLSYVCYSFYLIAILFTQDVNLYINKSITFMYALFALYALVAILKINFKTEKLNISLLSGLFIKNRVFSYIFSIGILFLVNIIPSIVTLNNFQTAKDIYQLDKAGFWIICMFAFCAVLILLNALRMIKALYTKNDINLIKKLTKRTTLNYVVPCVIFIFLIIKMFL